VNAIEMPNVSRRMPFVISSVKMIASKMDLYLCVNPWIQREKARIIQI
jgi:hypothetical protein